MLRHLKFLIMQMPLQWRQRINLSEAAILLKRSDAHYPDQIGGAYTIFDVEELSFGALKSALQSTDNPPQFFVK